MVDPISAVSINRVNLITSLEPAQQLVKPVSIEENATQALTDEKGKSFANYIKDQLDSVINTQKHADNLVRQFTIGENVDINEMVLAIQKASLGLSFAVAVRNKALEAYQEISRMQI